MTTFAELGVSEAIVASLGKRDIVDAFPIQTATIQAALAGRDICGKAPTGSGKTLAFGIPAVDLSNEGTPWRPSVLILSPTRELASQIKDELEPLAKARDRSILTVFGGTNIERDIKRLEKGIDILVACPGRLEDLIGRRCCELRNVELVVVDEADRMADMGFLPSVKRILDQTPGNRHTLLFSATLDGDVDMLIKRYQDQPLTFEVEEQVGEIGDVEHSWYLVQPVDRIKSAVNVLERYYSSIVFCRTRRGCDRVAKMFVKNGLPAVAIHGDRSQSQRERALKDFTTGKAQVLVATDVAARGIHVDNVALVMHYDPAGSDKDYIHRSGRTGRAGQDGRVISMVVEDKKKIARQLQKDLGMKPGFDDYNIDDFPAVVDRPTRAFEPEPKAKRSSGNRDKANQGGARNQRGDDNRGRHQASSNRKRGEGDRNRGQRDDRGRRDRDDRDRSGRGAQGRSTPGKRGQRDSNDRDRRGPQDRDERRPDGKRRTPRRRAGSNDWFPPGYHDDKPNKRSGGNQSNRNRDRDDERPTGGRGTTSRNKSNRNRDRDDERPTGGRGTTSRNKSNRNRDRDDERDERSTGGRGTTQRKNRSTKGRHVDKGSSKNKGKRRKPKSR